MTCKLFIDVNVLLDYFLNRKSAGHTEKIFRLASEGLIEAYVSASVIQTVSYYLKRAYSVAECKDLLLEFLKFTSLTETRMEDIGLALNSSMTDIEDAIHFYTAIGCKIDFVLTEDLEFQKVKCKGITVVSPKEFIALKQAFWSSRR